MAPNNSFKPNLLRYGNGVAEEACHAVACTAQVGLTRALGIMIHAIVLSALLLLGPCFSAYAQEIKCPTASRDEMIGNDSSTCRCGTDLGNVTLTPPRGLKLKAACRLRIWQTDRFVEIPKSRPVNLDRYDSRGNSNDGDYYFYGHLRIAGVIRFQPSDGGEVFFLPSAPVEMPKSTIEPSFRIFTLVPEGPASKYSIDKRVRAMECAEAQAEIVVREVLVIVNDSEAAGAYPIGIDLLRISPYKPCKRP